MRVSLSALRRRHWRDVSIEALVGASGNEPARLELETDLANAATPERELARRELFAVLERCVAESLTERQRQVVIAELRAMPQEEIASQLGKSRNAVYKLGHDARRSLQRALEQAGYSLDAVRSAFE